jgi:hypothetical protein
MAKWEGFSEEDIKKVSACERLVEGNIIKELLYFCERYAVNNVTSGSFDFVRYKRSNLTSKRKSLG